MVLMTKSEKSKNFTKHSFSEQQFCPRQWSKSFWKLHNLLTRNGDKIKMIVDAELIEISFRKLIIPHDDMMCLCVCVCQWRRATHRRFLSKQFHPGNSTFMFRSKYNYAQHSRQQYFSEMSVDQLINSNVVSFHLVHILHMFGQLLIYLYVKIRFYFEWTEVQNSKRQMLFSLFRAHCSSTVSFFSEMYKCIPSSVFWLQ